MPQPFRRRLILDSRVFTPYTIPGLVHWSEAINPANTLSTAAVAGTGTITEVSGAITGVGTKFLSEGRVGDTISGVGIDGTVSVITSDTAMTVTGATGAGAGVGFTWNPTAGVSDRVTTIADLSPIGANTLTQATFAKKMSLTSAANGYNGRRTFLGDGLSDVWVGANFLNGQSGMIVSVYVLSNSPPDVTQTLWASSDEAGNTNYVIGDAYISAALPKALVGDVEAGSTHAFRGGTSIVAGSLYIVIMASNGSAYAITLNGAVETLTSLAGTNNGGWFADVAGRDNVTIGAIKYNATEEQWLRGKLLATLMYDSVAAVDYTQYFSAIATFCASRYG